MSETQTTEQEVSTTAPTPAINPFAEDSWKETPIVEQQGTVEAPKGDASQAPVQPTTPAAASTEEDQVVEPNVWLKEQFGYETVDDAKKEIDELRKLRETAKTPAQLKFANEQSEKFFEALKEGKEDEIYNYLNTKRELSKVDQLKADEAIRLNIKYGNPHFKDADIQDVFEEQYAKPAKPVQEMDEEDADYSVRVQQWQGQVEKIDRKIERDAFAAKQQLAKYNSELVLPDIPKAQSEVQQIAEDPELEAKITAFKGQVFQKLDSDAPKFNGYNVTYKDEAVEIPIAFTMTPEEKSGTLQLIKEKVLGEHYNFNDYFNSRWFDEKGNPKVEQMMHDVYLMNNPEKVFQKFANEAATKRLEHKIKEASNIKIDATPQGTFNPQTAKTEFDQLASQVWGTV